MKRLAKYVLIASAVSGAHAQQLHVSGKVTYLSAGTVYVSIGTNSGVQDSSVLFVVTATDTAATLKVIAVSSKSSACIVVTQKRNLVVGDRIAAMFEAPKKEEMRTVQNADTTSEAKVIRGPQPISTKQSEKSFLNVQGRMSLQYYSSIFENSSYNFMQPGAVLNLHATSPDVPLKLDVYGNLRTIARGGISPFSNAATNDSRIYRFSLEYDDQVNDIVAGRIIPAYAPSIGSIDGISYSRRAGNFIGGASFGFQPPYNLQWVSTDTRKVSIFGQYQTQGPVQLSLTGAYARTYVQSLLDREAVSFMVNGYTAGGFSIYGYSDVDLRMKQGEAFNFNPSLSMGSANVSYRFTDYLTVGLGVDASRAVFPFSTVQFIADSLLDRTLRSGATLTVNVNLTNGLGIFNTYSPRSTDAGFGSDYLNSSSLYFTNALSTGTTVRATYTMNENEFTSSRGYGFNLERSFYGVSLTVRYQRNNYRILQLNQFSGGETLGGDLMTLFSRHLSFVASFDEMRGYGPRSYTMFSELSWRF